VDNFKTRVDAILAQEDPDGAEVLEHDEASTAKLFEEIKVMFQDLPSRVDSAAAQAAAGRPRRRMHPGMLEEMVHMTGRAEPNPGLAALIIVSGFRDDVPWLYEMGVELYRLSLTGDTPVFQRALRAFVQAAEVAAMGPFSRELRSGRELRMLIEELPMLLHRFDFDRAAVSESDDEPSADTST
jgi:hypothetical protein